MPQQHTGTKITIFVASPSDVEDERSRLDQVISNLNNAYQAFVDISLGGFHARLL